MAHSFANLPQDVLNMVFARAFDGRAAPLWADEALQLWTALRLVCRRWNQVGRKNVALNVGFFQRPRI